TGVVLRDEPVGEEEVGAPLTYELGDPYWSIEYVFDGENNVWRVLSALGGSEGGGGGGEIEVPGTAGQILTSNGSGDFGTPITPPSGSLVGTSGSQTLYDKTLSSPTIVNNPNYR